MNETQAIDVVFMYFYNTKNSLLPNNLSDGKISKDLADAIRHCNRLADLGFLDKEPTENNPQKTYAYRISTKGVHFIDALPMDTKTTPYTYYAKLEEGKRLKGLESEELVSEVNKLRIQNLDLHNKLLPLQTKELKGKFIVGIVAAIGTYTLDHTGAILLYAQHLLQSK
jgi:hypothetical protein